MLEMRPDCERCGRDLPADADGARICSFECSYCSSCAEARPGLPKLWGRARGTADAHGPTPRPISGIDRAQVQSVSGGRVLIVAGSDSGGGAGIQGDIKTVTVLGGHAATAITALTVQNTLGVQEMLPVPPAFVAAQMRAVLDDIGADAIKIGMLGSAETMAAVADVLESVTCPIVLDPVMVAKGGASLIAADAVAALRVRLLPMAMLITPNAPELSALTGLRTNTAAHALAAGRMFAAKGMAVLVKGGHLDGDPVVDTLIEPDGCEHVFASPRQHTPHTHGTGCALASAITTGLAQGMALAAAVARAHAFVAAAIRTTPGLGRGNGPLGHLEAARALG